MCGRYTLTFPDPESLAAALGSTLEAEAASTYRPHFNAAPGTAQIVLRRRDSSVRELVVARWGLSRPGGREGGGPLPINARSETVRKRGMFQAAFASRRCVVPATGFFEWTGPKGARRPIWFRPRDSDLLCLAGLYASSPDPGGGESRSFAILTVPSNEIVARVHDRMPAIIDRADVDRWLDGTAEEAEALLVPAPPGALIGMAVSPRANSAEHDDPACLEPWDPSEPAQRSLFGSRSR